jgi:ATP-dependent DNA helicase RecG
MTQHELDTIIQSGEGYKTEFKRNVNTDLSKELVAFANASGGRIFIGIEDNGTVSGVTIDNSLKSKVAMMAHECDPAVEIELEAFNNVLILNVPEGKDKPYRCTNGFYIRNGASSIKLGTQEIIGFIQSEGKVKFDELKNKAVKYPEQMDKAAIARFKQLCGITATINDDELLINLGLLYPEPLVINNTGVLFFVKNPTRFIPQSAVTCVAYKGNTKVDILDKKTFEFDLISNIDETIAFLKRHLNLAYEIKAKRRVEKMEIPEVVLREAIVNAAAHRDYFEKGATVMIELFDNRVEISNPGGLPKGLKEEDFGKRTLARNPLITALLHRAGYIEKLGTGIPRIKQIMIEAGLPEPEFEFDKFFVITLKKMAASFNKKPMADLNISGTRFERIKHILDTIKAGKKPDVATIAKSFSVNVSTIRKDFLLLEEKGWLKGSGTTTNRVYELTEMAIARMEE